MEYMWNRAAAAIEQLTTQLARAACQLQTMLQVRIEVLLQRHTVKLIVSCTVHKTHNFTVYSAQDTQIHSVQCTVYKTHKCTV